MKEYVKQHVKWFSQGALRFEDVGKVLYTDPYQIDSPYNDADFVFLTHSHYDHFSPDDIAKVIKADTVFIAPDTMRKEMQIYSRYKLILVNPHEKDVPLCGNVSFSTLPAYNTVKTKFHPKANNWVGYIIKIDKKSFYYTGDTEFVPEMENLKPDVIFVPLGTIYTMESIDEAVKSVRASKAAAAVPVHYAGAEGTVDDALHFCEILEGETEAFIL